MEDKDIYDEFICRKILNLILAVQSFYDYKYNDITIKKELGLISEEQYIKSIRDSEDYYETKKYYNYLCNEELEKVGFVSSEGCFRKVFTFDRTILKEMCQIEYHDLAPYVTKYIMPKQQYEEIKEKLKDEMELESELEES